MIESIFTRAYKYYERENLSPLENYTIELFAYCLENDLKFRNDILENLYKIKIATEFKIKTQVSYTNLGRPDIEINFNNTCILFECKIDSLERENQINDYCKILSEFKKHVDNKVIIFLTKNYEPARIGTDKIEVYNLRWHDVSNLISNENNIITQQFKQFLKDFNMEEKNFSVQDALTLKTLSDTLSKMDEVLYYYKTIFESKFGNYSKSTNSTLHYEYYSRYSIFKHLGINYFLSVGFYWWYDDGEPYVGLQIEVPIDPQNKELIKIFEEELHEPFWEKDSDREMIYFGAQKRIFNFMIEEEKDSIDLVKEFIDRNIEQLEAMKLKYPLLFKAAKEPKAEFI